GGAEVRGDGLGGGSAARVRGGPWAGLADGFGGVAVDELPNGGKERLPVRVGRSVRPTDPANRTSPEKRQPSAWNARCPGEWPGTETTSNEIPAASIVSPPTRVTLGVQPRIPIPG